MLEFINTSEFVQYLFDQEDLVEKAGQIVEAIQRFLGQVDP